jgi:prophage antirepressor-like protein
MPNQTTEELAYADAYQQLHEGLAQFKTYAKTNKKTVSSIQNIIQTISADSKVTPANKEINDAQRVTQDLINDKRKEVQELSRKVQNYDAFISNLQKDNVQLVKEETTTLNISTPLMKLPQATKEIISSQEDPSKTYLDLNK